MTASTTGFERTTETDMPTDDERREVAQNMRDGVKIKAECELLSLNGSSAAIRWLISYVVFGDKKYHSGVDLLDRLADLIEPHRGSGGRTILCAHCENVSWCGCELGDEEGGCDFEPSVTEGEPPYNLYTLYEVVFRRRPRDKYAIEDDEVEELVDALLDICNAPGHDVIQRPQPSCDRDALLALADEMEEFGNLPIKNPGIRVLQNDDFSRELGYARRIRKALGVSDD